MTTQARAAVAGAVWPIPPERMAEVDLEKAAWTEISELIAMLTPQERLAPGYFVDPVWSVKDLVGHIRAWQVEARQQLIDIGARSYRPRDIDIDDRNAEVLHALRGEPWERVWDRAVAARSWFLEAWFQLREPDDVAAQWVRKAGAEHYAEHLPRLRVWVSELIGLRVRPPLDERDP
ncbi:MAG TPA: hypothetical protein VFS32_02715 [Candidatus Limnocylindrales bacterium]|nr:hypothetical protein [Candidatus Limnocylindrales bacterium]